MKERLLFTSLSVGLFLFISLAVSSATIADPLSDEVPLDTVEAVVLNEHNIVLNGDFETGDLTNWQSFIADFAGVSATLGVNGGEASITGISGAGGQIWHVQLNQVFTTDQINALNVGEFYTISFDARSDVDGRQLRMFFGEDGGAFAPQQILDVNLSTTMETYTVSFPLTATFGAMKLGFEMGLSNADVYIDNVALEEGGNLIDNGDFAAGDLTSWDSFNADFDGVFADFNVVNEEAHITNITGAGGQIWHVQLNQLLTAEQIAELEVGAVYTATFDARSTEEGRQLRMFFGEDGGGFAAIHIEDVELTTEMETYSAVFEVGATFGAMKLGFEMGLSNADVYLDNVALLIGGELPDDGDGEENLLDLPVTFNNPDINYGLTDFGGTFSSIQDDPFNPNNKVAQTTKPLGAETWAGTTVGGTVGFANAIPFDADNQIMSVRVLSPAAGLPIRLKVEDASDPTVSVETEAVTSVVGDWETLEFDFSNEAEGTAEINLGSTYDKASIFFNFGTTGNDAGELIFYWDDMAFGTPDTDGESQPADVAMEENFIMFANGVHVTIPQLTTGTVITDPTDDTNNVIQFNFGGFQIGGFLWGSAGIDMSERVAEGNHLIMRIWSSAENSADARLINGNNAPKVIFQDASTTDGFAFRAQLELPDELHNEEWHDIAIPLPEFLTQAELEEAKANDELDGFAALWEYWGTWSDARNVHVDSPEDPDWREFNWDRVRSIGIYWDQDPFPNAPIFVDNVAIGVPGEVNFGIASDVPAPLTSVNAIEAGNSNIVSWTPREDIAAYSVYFSGEPITDINADNVFFWKTVPFTADAFEAEHPIFSPLDADPIHTYHYAVSASNLWGIPNDDVSQSQTSVNATGLRSSWIFQLTPEEENAILDHLEVGGSSLQGWPVEEFPPFVLNAETSAHPQKPASDDILSSEVYMAYGTSEGETIFYVNATVYDNELVFNPAIQETEQVDWNFFKRDHFQLRLGTYEVDYVTGPTNNSFSENDQSDYLLNFFPVVFVETFEGITFGGLNEPDAIWVQFAGENNFPFAFPAAFDLVENESGQVVGYQINFAFTASELLAGSPTDGGSMLDELFVPPGENDFFYIPMTPSVVDDRDDNRDRYWEGSAHQLFYSWKPNFGPNFFSTPSDLSAVAIAGRGIATSIDENPFAELPNTVELRQNYPNPFNPTTNIQFNLPQAETVRLTIYNTIGQRIATLVNNQQFGAGLHEISFDASRLASGMYIYRLEAGNQIRTRKMMLIK
ncbi:MAG: carbohydrate binding domain-containing protein [Balneolaceae bacterium]